jgi:hypothetical protein
MTLREILEIIRDRIIKQPEPGECSLDRLLMLMRIKSGKVKHSPRSTISMTVAEAIERITKSAEFKKVTEEGQAAMTKIEMEFGLNIDPERRKRANASVIDDILASETQNIANMLAAKDCEYILQDSILSSMLSGEATAKTAYTGPDLKWTECQHEHYSELSQLPQTGKSYGSYWLSVHGVEGGRLVNLHRQAPQTIKAWKCYDEHGTKTDSATAETAYKGDAFFGIMPFAMSDEERGDIIRECYEFHAHNKRRYGSLDPNETMLGAVGAAHGKRINIFGLRGVRIGEESNFGIPLTPE